MSGMDDFRFKHALRSKLVAENLAGALWALNMLGDRMQTKEGNSPEWLELFRAKNAIQAQLGVREEALHQEYEKKGF
ncbi:hypothetical protein [Streptomyces mutomycini]|uniref:hypothetical protein n=1 Tax=Streptomyces mutomycini TaxID=284036 RepID=UPI0033CF1AD2